MIETKKCTKCGKDKIYSQFSKRAALRDGHRSQCRACDALYTISNKERATELYLSNREYNLKVRSDYYVKHKAHLNKQTRQYARENKDIINAMNAKRRATKLNATPKWADVEAIKGWYRLAKLFDKTFKEKHHVDHIVPLQGEKICGLHVTENLQILTAKENLKKSNHWESV